MSMTELKIVEADFAIDHSVEVWRLRLDKIDVVINCVGIIQESRQGGFQSVQTKAACALFNACNMAGVGKVIQISALGADDSAFSQFHLSKKAADDYLTTLDLDWTILHPSIVYGDGAASTELFRVLAALPLTPLPGDGEQLIQPIGVEDFCQLILLAVKTPRLSRKCVDVAGAEAIRIRHLLSLMKSWLGMPAKHFVRIPTGIILLVLRVFGFANKTPLTKDSLNMLNAGSTADIATLVELTGFKPQSVRRLISHDIVSKREFVDARQYFIFPMLRVVLTLLWIFSGYVSAFVYPVELSLSMLARVGISGDYATLFLYFAVAMDALLGFALLVAFRTRLIFAFQIVLIVIYTLFISMACLNCGRIPSLQ